MQNHTELGASTVEHSEPDDATRIVIALSLGIGYVCAVCLCMVCLPSICRCPPTAAATAAATAAPRAAHTAAATAAATAIQDEALARRTALFLIGCAFGPATAEALRRPPLGWPPAEPAELPAAVP